MYEFEFRIFLSYRSIFSNQSYIIIQKFTMSYTVYHRMTITPPDLKTVSCLATTCKSNFCGDPTENLGAI